MGITADSLWVWLLAYVIHTATGAVLPSNGSQLTDPGALSSLDKILIRGGYNCPMYSHPWMAAVFHQDKLVCGGVLVHPQWVLTAAHCFKNSYTIGLGMYDLGAQHPKSNKIEASLSVIHPLHEPESMVHDLMLIKLSKRTRKSQTIQPISVTTQPVVQGTKCLFSGWGLVYDDMYPRFLQCMDADVVPESSCAREYPWVPLYNMFCALGERKSMGDHKGDSGGPLICSGVLQGIYIGSKNVDGKTGFPDLFTNVYRYTQWIQETIKKR